MMSQPKQATHSLQGRTIAGFTLLEVMIALVILSIGVLGIVALQVSTYKSLQTSHNYAYAAMLASDMGDRILANIEQQAAYEHTTDVEVPSSALDCNADPLQCDNAALVTFDIDEWQTMVQGLIPGTSDRMPGALPGGLGEVDFIAGTPPTINIIVRWDDDLNGSTGTNCFDLTGVTQSNDDLDCYVLTL